jgi:transcriptional regulator GlxA family with amidase domain
MSPPTPPIPPDGPRRIEILAFPAVQLLDVAGPLQVFSAANERLAEGGRVAAYDVRVVAPSAEIAATAGLTFRTEPLSSGDRLDTLVVAGGQGVITAAADVGLADWVRRRAGEARRVASVCTGAFMLGAAGLLDGRRAVTHWAHCDELRCRFPDIAVESNPIFVRDGPVWTSAGVTAGIDLALALVEEDLGRTIALAVARHLVVFLKRPGGQAVLTLQAAEDRFGDLHAWIGEHLGEELSLGRLAQRAGMSERSFGRRYRELTGITPVRAVERLRVEAARHLLIETKLPMKRVASRCGFGTEETMRRAFLRTQGVGPKEYRDRFA